MVLYKSIGWFSKRAASNFERYSCTWSNTIHANRRMPSLSTAQRAKTARACFVCCYWDYAGWTRRSLPANMHSVTLGIGVCMIMITPEEKRVTEFLDRVRSRVRTQGKNAWCHDRWYAYGDVCSVSWTSTPPIADQSAPIDKYLDCFQATWQWRKRYVRWRKRTDPSRTMSETNAVWRTSRSRRYEILWLYGSALKSANFFVQKFSIDPSLLDYV